MAQAVSIAWAQMYAFHALLHTISQIILVLNAKAIVGHAPIHLFVFNAIKAFTPTKHHHIPASNAIQTVWIAIMTEPVSTAFKDFIRKMERAQIAPILAKPAIQIIHAIAVILVILSIVILLAQLVWRDVSAVVPASSV